MSDRDDRYNASRKGKARNARAESSEARRAYKAKWARRRYRLKRKG